MTRKSDRAGSVLAGSAAAMWLVLSLLVACRGELGAEPTPAVTPAGAAAPATIPAGLKPVDWDPAALRVAEQLAEKVRKAGIRCDDYGSAPYAMYDGDYRKKLPVPAAVTACDSDADEDLTFEVFADSAATRNFVEVKREYLCKRTHQLELYDFPGFPYVEGDVWIVEPDEKATADKLAPILGGVSKVAGCKPQR